MRRICVLDLETDPFEPGKMVHPFVAGFYDGSSFLSIWSPDCVKQMAARLEADKTESIIFAHNGGKFDWFFFLPYLNHSAIRIINNRIAQAFLGVHEIRDSFSILPFPLSAYKKTEIDYQKFFPKVREQHKEEIISYLRDDCVDLHTLVTAFFAEFGDKLTVGSSGLAQLKLHHKFKCGNGIYDKKFRERFYYGGRCQVFRAGVIHQPVTIVDVNSMYPHVMRSYLHPVGVANEVDKRITPSTCFVVADGRNEGAVPVRHPNGSLDFTVPHGRFYMSIHEWEAGLETKMFRPTKVVKTYSWKDRISFADFVEHFYTARNIAKSRGDKIHALFYKFVLNSTYGKFAQNPENFFDYTITEMVSMPEPWEPAYVHEGEYIIWRKPLDHHHYYNIATGASITGAARAMLMRGLHSSVDPLYCDTDSIICRSFPGQISDTELGAWKVEGTGDMAAISGKKIYAVFQNGVCIKKAHKGVSLSDTELIRIAKGESVTYRHPVPALKFDGSHSFTVRTVRRTAR